MSNDKEIERTEEIINLFYIKNGEELTQLHLKIDVLLLACVFENFMKNSINNFDINTLYCVSSPDSTWHCGVKYTDIRIQTLQDKDMILLLEKKYKSLSSVMGDRYVKSDENKTILYIDASELYGHSMSQPLPFHKTKIERNVCLQDILNTPHISDIGCFIAIDLKCPVVIRQKTKRFHFAFENKIKNKHDFIEHLKKNTYHIKTNLRLDRQKEVSNSLFNVKILFLNMQWLLIKFVRWFHLNKANGWKNI